MPTKHANGAAAIAGKNGYSLISKEKFRQLYTAMLTCRMLDERIRGSFGSSYMGSPGQEASMAGLVVDLKPEDALVLSPRSFLSNFVKGASLNAILHHLSPAPVAANGHVAHNALPGTATTKERIGIATGAALARKLEKNGHIAVVFLGAAAADLHECAEAFEIAVSHRLPILYVVENEPGNEQESSLRAVCPGIPLISVDGRDVVAVYRVAQESIARAREGSGPALIECLDCHPASESHDPLARMEHYLQNKGIFRDQWKSAVTAEFGMQLDRAFKASS